MIVTYAEQRNRAGEITGFNAATDTPFRWEIYRSYEKWGGSIYATEEGERGRSVKAFVGETPIDVHHKITAYLTGLGKTIGAGARSTGIGMLKTTGEQHVGGS